MYKDKISLQQAQDLVESGHITIVDASPETTPAYPEGGEEWKENFIRLQERHRHVQASKLLDFLSARYLIEIDEGIVDNDKNTYSWRYVHGIENSKIKEKSTDDTEYVYVLVNPGYTNLVKIGMTIHDVSKRVKGINVTATVQEWVPKFALPVSKGNALRVEQSVHRAFKSKRVSSDLGNEREFFELDPFTAFDKVREVGEVFRVGNPIVY